jgi:hypothetical protein
MKIKRKELRELLNYIDILATSVSDDHFAEMEEYMGKKEVKYVNKMLKKMGKKLTEVSTTLPPIAFTSESGDRYMINANTYDADIAAYETALDAGDDDAIEAFESGSTGWSYEPE